MPEKVIPYGRHYLDQDDIDAVVNVLKAYSITQGPVVDNFGEELANYTGAKFGIPVSSGSAALHIAVSAIDIKPDDEVITCPITFCATANAVLYQRGIPVFVDINENTLNIDPNLIEEKITNKTKAIMPIDFRGHPAPLPEICEIAKKYGLTVIEDGSHSIGSSYEDQEKTYKCGDGIHADLCTFSFHPVKHITTGEGGAVMTNNKNLYKRIFNLRKHGIDRRNEMLSEEERRGEWFYDMECLGFNYRITDFQCALGISQLKKIEKNKNRRREIVDYYNETLNDIEELILPYESTTVNSNFHLYVIQIKDNQKFDRYDLFCYLREKNYWPMVHYIPVHLLSYYRNRFGYKRGDYPKSEDYYDRSLTIPLYPSLKDAEVEQLVKDIKTFII